MNFVLAFAINSCCLLFFDRPISAMKLYISDSAIFSNRIFTTRLMNCPQVVGRYYLNSRAALIGILLP